MIRYPITVAELRQKIKAEPKAPNWLKDAAKRTATFKAAGYYDEKLEFDSGGKMVKASPIWSKIKPVFMRLQYEKCAYCERQLSSEEWGRGEHDLEHFRPKSKAKPWKASASLQREGVVPTPASGGKHDAGYHLLSYHPLNYCASCKTCNSGLKSDIFPIAGVRNSMGANPRKMAKEKALLIYPLGSIDTDPETLIDFHGLSPRAIPTRGFGRHRALSSISFFQLKNPKRKELYRERARQIVAVHSFLLNRVAVGDIWDGLIAAYQDSSAPHSSCTRSFVRLFKSNRTEADEIFRLAADYLKSVSS
jgi:hypothetical protein